MVNYSRSTPLAGSPLGFGTIKNLFYSTAMVDRSCLPNQLYSGAHKNGKGSVQYTSQDAWGDKPPIQVLPASSHVPPNSLEGSHTR